MAGGEDGEDCGLKWEELDSFLLPLWEHQTPVSDACLQGGLGRLCTATDQSRELVVQLNSGFRVPYASSLAG